MRWRFQTTAGRLPPQAFQASRAAPSRLGQTAAPICPRVWSRLAKQSAPSWSLPARVPPTLVPSDFAPLSVAHQSVLAEPGCCRKKRIISRLASGPRGSVYDPAALPPDHAWPAP